MLTQRFSRRFSCTIYSSNGHYKQNDILYALLLNWFLLSHWYRCSNQIFTEAYLRRFPFDSNIYGNSIYFRHSLEMHKWRMCLYEWMCARWKSKFFMKHTWNHAACLFKSAYSLCLFTLFRCIQQQHSSVVIWNDIQPLKFFQFFFFLFFFNSYYCEIPLLCICSYLHSPRQRRTAYKQQTITLQIMS